MVKKKIKNIAINYTDGTTEKCKKGFLTEIREIGSFSEMRVRTWNFDGNDMQRYLTGLTQFIAKNLDDESMDALEKFADIDEMEIKKRD